MASVSVAPTSQKVSQIKSKLLNPALTSHFMIYLGLPKDQQRFRKYMAENALVLDQDRLQLSCCEAFLPGSTLATTELKNDFTGVTERHAYRRIYQDRIDLTFYCDAQQYMAIRFFESWMKFIMNENSSGGISKENYSYRVSYPDEYKGSGLEVTKFEKNLNQRNSVVPLTYNFVNVFPVAITSMPVSYDTSQLLKCTVSMNYTRYYIGPGSSTKDSSSPSVEGDPFEFDYGSFEKSILDLDLDFPNYDTVGNNFFEPSTQAQFNSFQGTNSGLPTFSSGRRRTSSAFNDWLNGGGNPPGGFEFYEK